MESPTLTGLLARPCDAVSLPSAHGEAVPQSLHASPLVRTLLSGFLALALMACVRHLDGARSAAEPGTVSAYSSAVQPVNVGDVKRAATAYHDSGAYERDLAAVTSTASLWLAERAR